jgi:hypothetical protein
VSDRTRRHGAHLPALRGLRTAVTHLQARRQGRCRRASAAQSWRRGGKGAGCREAGRSCRFGRAGCGRARQQEARETERRRRRRLRLSKGGWRGEGGRQRAPSRSAHACYRRRRARRRAASARRGAAAARAASASRLREPLGPVLKSAVRGRLLGRHTGSGDRIAPASARHAAGCRSRRRSTKPRRSTPHRRTGQGEDGSRTSTRGSRDVERPPTTTLAQHGLTSMPSELRDLHAVGAIMRQRRVAEALTCGLLQRSAPLRRPRRGLRLIF